MALNISGIEQLHYTVAPMSSLVSEIERTYADAAKGTSARARAAFLMAAFLESRQYSIAKGYYNECYRIAQKLGDTKLLSDALHGKAVDAFKTGRIEKFNKLEEQALALSLESNHPFRTAYSYFMLGMVASMYGMHENCSEYFSRSLQIAEMNGFEKLQVSLNSELSQLMLSTHDVEKSKVYIERALSLAIHLGLVGEILEAQVRLATIELEAEDYSNVVALISQVRATLPPENHSLWCVTHTLMGKVHEAKRRYDKAETEFRAALELADYVNAERVRSNVHTHLAELYLKTKKPEAALTEALAALADAETAQDSYVRKEALRCVHDCYKALGQYKEAHEYLERYNALVVESDTALLKNRLEYHALKSEYEKEKVKSEEKTKQSDLLRIKLDYKERELTEKIRHLLRQAEAVRQFRDDLRSLVRRTPSDDPYVKDIRARLSSFTEDELNWQEFEKEFREVHPDFLRTLTAKYPDLTQMEQRIAAMLRMELKSFDIARLFCVTERAVEFHRLNLRKKLGLKRGQDLAKFLGEI